MRSAIGLACSWISENRWSAALCALVLSTLTPLMAAGQDAAPPAADPAATPAAADPAAPGGVEPATQTPLAQSAAAAPAPAQASTPTAVSEGDPEQPEPTEPFLSLSAQIGVGYMSGGHGGLFSQNRSPLALDAQVLTVREPRYLIGGALRIELEGAKAVAGIFRFQLRHPFGPIELRPGIGVPFYIAPRTMLGPEAGIWGRLTFSKDLALLAAFSASAFVMGDDVPKGSTVVMLQIFIGAELFI
jgi:hypothetical protein